MFPFLPALSSLKLRAKQQHVQNINPRELSLTADNLDFETPYPNEVPQKPISDSSLKICKSYSFVEEHQNSD
jgi:hypothetical protein